MLKKARLPSTPTITNHPTTIFFTTEPAEQAEVFPYISVSSVVKVFRHRFFVLRYPPPLGARGLRFSPCHP